MQKNHFFLRQGTVLTYKRLILLNADECPRATTCFPSYMHLAFTLSSALHVDVSPLPDVCGLCFLSLLNSDLSHLAMELGSGPKNS